ncbi:MAG: hypothetical protein ACYTAN_05425 [Planctomycetota bacterium]|jgi:hypothetical protein
MMRVKIVNLVVALVFVVSPALSVAQVTGQEPEEIQDVGWPRSREKGDQRVTLYQPQLDEWIGYDRISFRMAVAVTPGQDQEPAYGVASVGARTVVDHDSRTVLMKDPEVEFRFPNVEDESAGELESIAREILPNRQSIVVGLDRILAYVDKEQGGQREVEVGFEPPPIFHSEKPAVLVIFIGKPEFQPVGDTELMAAVNTNWDMLLDSKENKYYLLNDGSWLSSPSPLGGPWAAAKAPGRVLLLPDEENWSEIRKAYPGSPLNEPPVVFTSTEPAELIVTDGAPKYSPISGTALMHVNNTESPLFKYPREGNHYYLVAGRWFRAKGLEGPWTPATADLPDEFAKIPEDHEMAYVRVSVPGTEEAEDAILMASVPRTATVKVKGTTVDVTYEGEPRFVPIEGTTVSYAVNTAYQVFSVTPNYYCCYQGIWFMSTSATGPWVVCTLVPAAIYTIPASHPMHNVTYVYVYETDDEDEVETAYTGGYNGEYIAKALLLFGAALAIRDALEDDDDDYYTHYHYHPHWYSYGCGAIYNPRRGGYYRSARVYGPYGGAGRSAYYNPSTGAWARGGYRYGPEGSAWAARGYNPYTGTHRAAAGGSNIYGSWDRAQVRRGDDWVRKGSAEGTQGSVDWVRTSEGTGAIKVDAPGGEGVAIKGQAGNVFVGSDGNIYRRDEDGNWEQRGSATWNSTALDRSQERREASTAQTLPSTPTRPSQPGTERPTARPTQTYGRPSTTARYPQTRYQQRDVTGFQQRAADLRSGLERDAAARQRGSRSEQRVQRSSSKSPSRSTSRGRR